MITTKDILQSLKIQTECPKCQANWRNLTYDEIYLIIQNCKVCEWRFENEMSKVRR